MNESYTFTELEQLLYKLVVEQEKYYQALERGYEFDEIKKIYVNLKATKEQLKKVIPELRSQID